MKYFGVLVFGCLIFHLGSCSPIQRDVQEEEEPAATFEGDIRLSSIDNVDQSNEGDVDGPLNTGSTSKRNAQRDRRRLWPGKVVPYKIGSDVPESFKVLIQSAFDEFKKHNICITFVPHTNEDYWISFVHKSGCWSYVGRQFQNKGSAQELSLGKNCDLKGTIIHELLHALGFWHEQSRPDRNQYVEVMWENIKEGQEHNLNKYSRGEIDELGAVYDYNSIMHYGKKFFSKNGEPTLLGVGEHKNEEIGQRNNFSPIDVFEIKALYDCAGQTSGWGAWSSYGPCDLSCKKVRERFCASLDISHCVGADAYGISKETADCSQEECNAPVDGHWGRWSAWGTCSATCGKGTHTRTRKCDDPPPSRGGKACEGSSSGAGECTLGTCGLGADDCEFEKDEGIWKQIDAASNSYKWKRHKGSTATPSTGPTGDDSENGAGYYIYAEASGVATGTHALLESKEFPATSGRCMKFSYNMKGYSVGTLNVYLSVTGGEKKTLFTKSGDQQNTDWLKIQKPIVCTSPYKIIFDAERGPGYWADISLDNIYFKDGNCS